MVTSKETVSNTDVGHRKKSDKWIPWYFVAFFVFLAVMDGIFVFIANQTHTGVVTNNAYNEGLRYNQTITEAETQAQLGWTAKITYSDDTITLALRDSNSEALSGATVEAAFIRPTQDGGDFRLSLLESSSGIYEAAVTPVMGQWDVRTYVTWDQKQFQAAQRIVVQPK